MPPEAEDIARGGASSASLPAETMGGGGHFLAGPRGFIVWLGGSLAGITAMLYTGGYLVTRAHLNALGLYGLIDFSNDFFLQEGAKLFIAVTYMLTVDALGLLFVGCLIALPVAVALIAVRPLRRKLGALRWPAVAAFLGAAGRPRRVVFGVLFAVLVALESFGVDPFQAPLCVRYLLYPDTGISRCAVSGAEVTVLRTALLNNQAGVLQHYFEHLLGVTAAVAILTCIAWRIVAPWTARLWLIAPFAGALVIHLTILPMDYGVLQRSTAYPRVTLSTTDDVEMPAGARLYLLSATERDFVVWNADEKKLVWIPERSVKRAEIGEIADLFGPAAKPGARQGEAK